VTEADTCEFVCCDCQSRVIAFGYAKPPDPPRCATCAWIVEFIPPNERDAVRERLGHPLQKD
jgi:hypothetical protein